MADVTPDFGHTIAWLKQHRGGTQFDVPETLLAIPWGADAIAVIFLFYKSHVKNRRIDYLAMGQNPLFPYH